MGFSITETPGKCLGWVQGGVIGLSPAPRTRQAFCGILWLPQKRETLIPAVNVHVAPVVAGRQAGRVLPRLARGLMVGTTAKGQSKDGGGDTHRKEQRRSATARCGEGISEAPRRSSCFLGANLKSQAAGGVGPTVTGDQGCSGRTWPFALSPRNVAQAGWAPARTKAGPQGDSAQVAAWKPAQTWLLTAHSNHLPPAPLSTRPCMPPQGHLLLSPP